MKYFGCYRVWCSEIHELMKNPNGATPVTDSDSETFYDIMQREDRYISENMKEKVRKIISKAAYFEKDSLTLTMKKNIRKQYAYYVYGATKLSQTNNIPFQFEKGGIAEKDSIDLLSKLDGVVYEKNKEKFSNKYFIGVPDILIRENDKIIGVKDIKTPSDMPNFLDFVNGDVDMGDVWEMLGYLDILGLSEGEICYCLVDVPPLLREKKMNELGTRLKLAGASEKDIKIAVRSMEKSMTYSKIPEELRVRRFKVVRQNYLTKDVHEKVKKAKSYMKELHELFIKNELTLTESSASEKESIS